MKKQNERQADDRLGSNSLIDLVVFGRAAAIRAGQVVDRETLASAVKRLRAEQSPVVAVVVSSARAPDRGVQRTIGSLMSGGKQRWLVLLQGRDGETVSDKRLAAWYRLADASDVPADHVISLNMDQCHDQGEVYES